MKRLINILSHILFVMILIPVIGININTHICGQTEDVSKSLIIPGVLKAEECDKCHEVVVVKSCCSNNEKVVEKTTNEDKSEKGCCKDILEYNDFDYLINIPYALSTDYSSDTFIAIELYSALEFEVHITKITDLQIRRRPYSIDILSYKCSYLI